MPRTSKDILKKYYSCEMNELLKRIKEPLEEYRDFMNYASKICKERDPVKDLKKIKKGMGFLLSAKNALTFNYGKNSDTGIIKYSYDFLCQNIPLVERLFTDKIPKEIQKIAKEKRLDAYAITGERDVRDKAKRIVFSKKEAEEIFSEAEKIVDGGLELVEKIRNSTFLKVTNLFLGGVMRALDIPTLERIPPKEALEEAKKLGIEYFKGEIERLY